MDYYLYLESTQDYSKDYYLYLEPTEDYSKDYKKGPGKEADKTAKQKALARSAEGTKNIMSFFKKK